MGICSRDLQTNFTLKDCLFGAVKMTKNADPDKYFYIGYSIGFDSRSSFYNLKPWFCKKMFYIFGVDNSALRHTDNRKKKIF